MHIFFFDFLGDLYGPYYVEEGSSRHNLRGKVYRVTKKEIWVHTGKRFRMNNLKK